MSSRTNIWFPFYVGDYRAETQGFSHEERGVFVELLCAYCHRQSPLPDDDKQLAKLAGLSLSKWKRMRPTIAPIFTVKQGTWHLERLDEQIARGIETSRQRRLAGQKGGKKSWEKRQANAQANASNEFHEISKNPPKNDQILNAKKCLSVCNPSKQVKQMLNKSQSQSYISNYTVPDTGNSSDISPLTLATAKVVHND